jgi:hypothetical protein
MYSNNITVFFSNSDRDFYSENNNISQVYTYRYRVSTTKPGHRHITHIKIKYELL